MLGVVQPRSIIAEYGDRSVELRATDNRDLGYVEIIDERLGIRWTINIHPDGSLGVSQQGRLSVGIKILPRASNTVVISQTT